MHLRAHQAKFQQIINQIIAGSQTRNIVVYASPGAGKSAIPMQAGKLISAGLADKICWLCPRSSLQDQGERNFISPFFREMIGHNLLIRSSTNEIDPCRGTDGFITTLQAIAVDKYSTVLNELRRRRYILVIDEYHHLEAESGEWMKAVLPLYEAAKYRILLTGTLGRGDKKKIAFTPYRQSGDCFFPDLEGDSETHFIEYSRTDALADKSIIPLEFVLHDGQASWEKNGKEKRSKISTATPEARDALFTALHTGYAKELLETSVLHWKRHRKAHPSSRLLVVAANIKVTKEYTKYLQGQGLNALIATSDDDKAALKSIKKFKAGKADVLVTCQVAYEGLDCPSISHIACLTNIRSEPWIIQMCGRAVRIDPMAGPYETQKGYVFAPADRMFTELAARIDADQSEAMAVEWSRQARKESGLLPGEQGGLFGNEPRITPLSSRMLNGYSQLPAHQFAGTDNMALKTNSEIEADLRAQIESHIRTFSFQNRHNPKRINAEVYAYFAGKKRENMTIPELENCLSYIKTAYPLNFIRGTGRPRVSTKAVPINVAWKVA